MLGVRIGTLKEMRLLGYVVQLHLLVLGLYMLLLTYADHLITWLEQTVIVIVVICPEVILYEPDGDFRWCITLDNPESCNTKTF